MFNGLCESGSNWKIRSCSVKTDRVYLQARQQMLGRVKEIDIAKHPIHAEAGEVGQRGGQPPRSHREAGGEARQSIERRIEVRLAALMIEGGQL